MQQRRVVARRLGLLLALVGLALLVPVTPAAAHARLVATSPAADAVLVHAPTEVVLTFDEPVQAVTGGFRLYRASGSARLEATASGSTVRVVLPTGLAIGSYLLEWHVYSVDAHPLSGTLVFAVGERGPLPTEPPAPARVSAATGGSAVAQAAGYLGLTVAIGLTVFELLVLGGRGGRLHRRLVVAAAGLAAAAAVAGLPLTAARMGGSTSWRNLPLETSDAARLVLLASVALVAAGALPGRWRTAVAWTGVAFGMASFALVGHTRSFTPTVVVVGADLAHALAASVWLGGLVGLVVHLRGARRSGAASQAAAVVARFSGLAAVVLGVLVAAGGTLAVIMVGSWSALVGTAYGTALLVKLGLVAAAVAVAGWNRLRLVPRIVQGDGNGQGWRRLTRLLVVEALLLVAVLGATTVLTLQNPRTGFSSGPEAAAGHHVERTVGPTRTGETAVGAGVMRWSIEPGTVGANTVTLRYLDRTGQPSVLPGPPELVGYHPQGGLGPVAATVRGRGADYRATLDLLSSGVWQLLVTVRDAQGRQFVSDEILVQLAG